MPLEGTKDIKNHYIGLKANFIWNCMRRDIKSYIRECEVCQKCKVENIKPARLLQPLPIPTKLWSDISIYFIDALLVSKRFSVIFVVVDQFTKYAYVSPLSHPYTTASVAKLFISQIFKLYGMPATIVTNKDVTLTSIF